MHLNVNKRLSGYSRANMAAQQVVVAAETHEESSKFPFFNVNLHFTMVILKRSTHLIWQRQASKSRVVVVDVSNFFNQSYRTTLKWSRQESSLLSE